MTAGTWGTSYDGEYYSGRSASRGEAIAADPAARFVGQYEAPQLESYLSAELLIDNVLCQDDYCGDWADGSLAATKEQLAELTDAVRLLFRDWVERHGLMPQFGIVRMPEEIAANAAERGE
jgi:hypothetical protein